MESCVSYQLHLARSGIIRCIYRTTRTPTSSSRVTIIVQRTKTDSNPSVPSRQLVCRESCISSREPRVVSMPRSPATHAPVIPYVARRQDAVESLDLLEQSDQSLPEKDLDQAWYQAHVETRCMSVRGGETSASTYAIVEFRQKLCIQEQIRRGG